MGKIKGLIIKDILQLKAYIKSFTIFFGICIFSVFSYSGANEISMFVTIFICLGCGIFSFASFSYDEIAKADRYILCMPFSKKEIVLAKYIIIFMSIVFGAILGMILSLLLSYIVVKDLPIFTDLISCAIGAILGVSLMESVQIPFVYKFGREKARIWIFIITFAAAFLFGGIGNLIDGGQLNMIMNSLKCSYILNIGFQILLIVLIFWISYKISCNIYNKKEM